MNTTPISNLALLALTCTFSTLAGKELKAVEEWTFSPLKGVNAYFAAYKNPSDKDPLTEQQRATIRSGAVKSHANSNIPLLAEPVRMEDSISRLTKVSLALFDESRENPESPKGMARIRYDNAIGSDDQYVVWRTTFMDTYVLISDNTTCIYTVHRNVKHPDGGYLVTLVTIRNNIIGVSSYTMFGSAKRDK